MSQTPPTDPQPEPTEFVWNTAERLVTDELAATVAESSKQNTDLDMCGARHSIMARNIAEDVIVDLLNAGWVAPDGTRIATAPAVSTDQPATVDDTALIERAAVALAFGDVDEAKYFRDDALAVHERVYGPELAAKDVEVSAANGRYEVAFEGRSNAWEQLEKIAELFGTDPGDIEITAVASLVEEQMPDWRRLRRALGTTGTEDMYESAERVARERDAARAALDLENARAVTATGQLAARDERIALLQCAWDKARDANTAWLDSGGVALPEDWREHIVAEVAEHGYLATDAIVRKVESWRPATEPAEATEDVLPCGTCGKPYQRVEGMPHWADDRVVIERGWADGRCSECGKAVATAAEQRAPTRDTDGWCTCTGHQELKRQNTEGDRHA